MTDLSRADRVKAGERFQLAGLEYTAWSVTLLDLGRQQSVVAVLLEAVRPDGSSRLSVELRGDDWLTMTYRIPDEW